MLSLEKELMDLGKRYNNGIDVKLANHELRSLKKNGALILRIPLFNRKGQRALDRDITIKILDDHVDEWGRISLSWDGDRIKPRKRR